METIFYFLVFFPLCTVNPLWPYYYWLLAIFPLCTIILLCTIIGLLGCWLTLYYYFALYKYLELKSKSILKLFLRAKTLHPKTMFPASRFALDSANKHFDEDSSFQVGCKVFWNFNDRTSVLTCLKPFTFPIVFKRFFHS